VKFHDGTPLTSADVVFTFDSILAEDSLAYYRETILSQLDSYRAIDDHTVEFVASGFRKITLRSRRMQITGTPACHRSRSTRLPTA